MQCRVGEDDDGLLALHMGDLREAVGLTGVVDDTGSIAMHRGIPTTKPSIRNM